jgi:ABC-type nitrate/sulfonate/bicarbonate transport system permease component
LVIGRALIGVIVAEFFTPFAGLGNLIVTNANSFRPTAPSSRSCSSRCSASR